MINWMDVMVAQQMRADALARAEKERLVRQVQRRHPWAREHYRLVMAQFGEQLVVWGWRLKARYAAPGIADAISGTWAVQQPCCAMESPACGC